MAATNVGHGSGGRRMRFAHEVRVAAISAAALFAILVATGTPVPRVAWHEPVPGILRGTGATTTDPTVDLAPSVMDELYEAYTLGSAFWPDLT